MILLINNKQVSLNDFIAKVEEISGKKIPLEQIKSNMEFTYNRVKNKYDLGTYLNTKTKVPKEKKQDDVLASFNVFDEKSGETFVFRFASRVPYTNPKDPNALVFTPKAIDFSGGVFSFEPREINKVVYLYCNPSCSDSPFYNPNKVYKYSHNNLKAASQRKKEVISRKRQAFEHAGRVDEMEIKVLALGLGIDLIPNADADDIRTALQEYALEKPEEYLKYTQDESVKFDGMIQDALANGYIQRRSIGGATSFEFTGGRQAGKQILLVTDQGVDAVKELKTYMKQNIGAYYDDMSILNQEVSANLKADQYIKARKEGLPKEVTQPYKEELLVSNIMTFSDSKLYLIEAHPEKGNPSQAKAKEFLEKILAGEITDDNVSEHVGEYIKQS